MNNKKVYSMWRTNDNVHQGNGTQTGTANLANKDYPCLESTTVRFLDVRVLSFLAILGCLILRFLVKALVRNFVRIRQVGL